MEASNIKAIKLYEMTFNARELEYRHKDADAALAYANYILRGDAGKEENA